jgi:hypothetical protein
MMERITQVILFKPDGTLFSWKSKAKIVPTAVKRAYAEFISENPEYTLTEVQMLKRLICVNGNVWEYEKHFVNGYVA